MEAPLLAEDGHIAPPRTGSAVVEALGRFLWMHRPSWRHVGAVTLESRRGCRGDAIDPVFGWVRHVIR